MDSIDYIFEDGVVSRKTSHYLIAGISLVTAISFNNVIIRALNAYFPLPNNNLAVSIIYAMIMLFVLVVLIKYLPDTTAELPKKVAESMMLRS